MMSSHIAAGQSRRNPPSSRDLMAIGFLAPQHADHASASSVAAAAAAAAASPMSPSRTLPYPASRTSTGVGAAAPPRQQLEALAYNVNVQASLDARPYGGGGTFAAAAASGTSVPLPPIVSGSSAAVSTRHYQQQSMNTTLQQQNHPSSSSFSSYESSSSTTSSVSPTTIRHSVAPSRNNQTRKLSSEEAAAAAAADRGQRERRDPYSDEMQFFIMYARIIEEQDWRKIEDEFEHVFGQRRPRDGLTAVYYRTRTRWGMQQVLKGGPDKCRRDVEIVDERARDFSHYFLRKIGYSR